MGEKCFCYEHCIKIFFLRSPTFVLPLHCKKKKKKKKKKNDIILEYLFYCHFNVECFYSVNSFTVHLFFLLVAIKANKAMHNSINRITCFSG